MSENTKLWDILGRTDPKHTKQFKRGGGFKGTAIKPMWSFRRMTEEFGPCGIGWGVGEPSFQVVNGDNREVLVYCTVKVWFKQDDNHSQHIYGVGGDKVVTYIKESKEYNRPERWESDDEAFKKAFTDAVTNALKLIGVGADVHMGLFDDSKYVREMADEFAEPEDKPLNLPKPKSSAELKRNSSWDVFQTELAECDTLIKLEKFKTAWREKIVAEGWNASFKAAARDQIEGREKAIRDAVDDEPFPGDRPSVTGNAYVDNMMAG